MIQVCDPPRTRQVRRLSTEEFCQLVRGEVSCVYRPRSDVLRMLVYYILSMMSVNSPADSGLRAALCHYPENYITLMEYYDPAEHGMEGYTRR